MTGGGPSPRWRTSANAIEDEAGSERTRPPEPTFLAIAHAWAAGESLDDVLEDEDLSGGDFVRNMKQVIDLLGQVADVTDGPTAEVARGGGRAALQRRRRCVVHCRDVGVRPE